MKTSPRVFFHNTWLILTEVPGWADAPLAVRLSRTLPIVLPCLGLIGLITWNLVWFGPQVRTERAAHASLVNLESEVESLQLANSEQQAHEFSEQAAEISRQLISLPGDLDPLLADLRQEAVSRGWEISLLPGDHTDQSVVGTRHLTYLSVRGKLTLQPDNKDPYASLMTVLSRFTSSGKRIDLIRLAIRADEKRWQSVDFTLRLACSTAHEKTP